MENENRIFKDYLNLIENHVDNDDGAVDQAHEAGQASEAQCPRAQPITCSIETQAYHAMCLEQETNGSGREIGPSDQDSPVLLLAYQCCTVDAIEGVFDAGPPPTKFMVFPVRNALERL
jgi:hypothetical protein